MAKFHPYTEFFLMFLYHLNWCYFLPPSPSLMLIWEKIVIKNKLFDNIGSFPVEEREFVFSSWQKIQPDEAQTLTEHISSICSASWK